MNNRIISSVYMAGNTKYEYCPYCVKRLEETGKFYKDFLKPLKRVILGIPTKRNDGTFDEVTDEHYECMSCQKMDITPDSFSLVYGDKNSVFRSKGVPFEEKTSIWDMEQKTLVPAHWDNALKNYVKD